MKRIHIIAIAAVLTLNLTLCLPAQAQLSTDATEDLSGDAPPQPSDVPVDGGLSLLLAAGAAYGGRRLHLSKQPGRKNPGSDSHPGL